MKTLGNGKHLLALRDHTGHAQRILVRLGARVDEEHAFEPRRGDASQLLGRVGADVERDGIALEQQLAALLLDRSNEPRMPVAERRDSMTAVQVENTPAILGEDVASTGAFRDKRQLSVDRDRQRRLAEPRVLDFFVQRRHQVHPGAGMLRPAASGRFHSRFIHCTAPPAAPLTRLSMAAMTTTVSPSVATPI